MLTAIKPVMNAIICVMNEPWLSRIAKAAPNPAPADTPRISGDTRGFLKIPWNDAPEIDKAAPTIMTAAIRGNLISQTTAYTEADRLVLIWNNPDPRAIITSAGDTGYLPMRKEARKSRIGKMVSTVTIEIFLAILLFI